MSFLDIVINDSGLIKTNCYCKPTYSGRILNFDSNHPVSQKNAMVYNLVNRAILLSDEIFHEDNLLEVKKTPLANFYPNDFVQTFFNLRLQKVRSNIFSNNKKMTNFITFPFYNDSVKKLDNIFEEQNMQMTIQN